MPVAIGEGVRMATRWRRAAVIAALVAAIASGWVYSIVAPGPETPSPPPTVPASPIRDPVHLRHGRVTKIRDVTTPGDRQWIMVEHPVWNVFQMREYVDRMWFCVSPGTVTDRRTGQPGELAIGQRVSILWNGEVVVTDPGRCYADRVVIEIEELPRAQP
jgi:hypothetical protein